MSDRFIPRLKEANVAIDSNDAVDQLPTGVYWGWASVNNGDILPMATSIGWNPYFADVKRKTFVRFASSEPSAAPSPTLW